MTLNNTSQLMTGNLISALLTEEQQAQVCGILSVGCDRQTAADYLGCSLADIRQMMQHDSTFSDGVRRAEAGVELMHMRNVQELAKDKKDWRASVWWLERRSPERFGRRSAGVVTVRQLKAFAAILAEAVQEDVQCEEDRERLLARLSAITASVDQLLRDRQAGQNEPSGITDSLTIQSLLGETAEADRPWSEEFDNEV